MLPITFKAAPATLQRRQLCKALLVCGLGSVRCGRMLLASAAASPTVSWSVLQTLDLAAPLAQQKGSVMQFNNKRVSIPGFMVPLEDDLDAVSEFLLVPYAGACIHVPPPPPNQMVYVKMQTAAKVQVTFTDPIVTTGTLHVSTVQSPYGAVSFDLQGETVAPYQPQ